MKPTLNILKHSLTDFVINTFGIHVLFTLTEAFPFPCNLVPN